MKVLICRNCLATTADGGFSKRCIEGLHDLVEAVVTECPHARRDKRGTIRRQWRVEANEMCDADNHHPCFASTSAAPLLEVAGEPRTMGGREMSAWIQRFMRVLLQGRQQSSPRLRRYLGPLLQGSNSQNRTRVDLRRTETSGAGRYRMSDKPKLMVHYRKHYTSKAWGYESWTAAREPTVPEVLAWLQEQNVGEEVSMNPCCTSREGQVMMSPKGDVVSGNGECAEFLLSPGRYLVVPLDPKEGS